MTDDDSAHASALAQMLRNADDDILREIGEDPDDHRNDAEADEG